MKEYLFISKRILLLLFSFFFMISQMKAQLPKPPGTGTKPVSRTGSGSGSGNGKGPHTKKPQEKPKTPSDLEYKIIVEANDFNDSYIKYKMETQSEEISFPTNHFIGIKFKKDTRYVLKVKEVVKKDQTYLELVKQLEPAEVTLPPNSISVYPYDCKGKEERIQTSYDIIYTQYLINSDGSINIRPVDYATPDFYKFSRKIIGFTFIEDYKYVLEVQKTDSDYILVNVLCEQKMNLVPDPDTIIYSLSNSIPQSFLRKKEKIDNQDEKNRYQDKPIKTSEGIGNYPGIPKSTKPNPPLDGTLWYLRYLRKTPKDSSALDTIVYPVIDNSYFLKCDSFLNKCSGITPCAAFEAFCSYNIVNKTFEVSKLATPTIADGPCEQRKLQRLFFDQLQSSKEFKIENGFLELMNNERILLYFDSVPR
jgi:hypothetical protein